MKILMNKLVGKLVSNLDEPHEKGNSAGPTQVHALSHEQTDTCILFVDSKRVQLMSVLVVSKTGQRLPCLQVYDGVEHDTLQIVLM
jgi:hypothetical protein